jgi:hypothetical protein
MVVCDGPQTTNDLCDLCGPGSCLVVWLRLLLDTFRRCSGTWARPTPVPGHTRAWHSLLERPMEDYLVGNSEGLAWVESGNRWFVAAQIIAGVSSLLSHCSGRPCPTRPTRRSSGHHPAIVK